MRAPDSCPALRALRVSLVVVSASRKRRRPGDHYEHSPQKTRLPRRRPWPLRQWLALALLCAALLLARGAEAALNSLVPVDHGFEFSGMHSDFAQQYYMRYAAKAEAPQLTRVATADLPDALQKELKTYALSWEELPGLLQRALLWDAGYALTSDWSILPVLTRNHRSMAEIFVPRKAYERTGCTPRKCVLPSGEVFYRHQSCDGAQMARVSLCALDGARQQPHAGMWGDGGRADTLPEVRATRHEWAEQNTSFLMYALHTVAAEVAYEACPAVPAMIIPCVPLALVANQSAWGAPRRGQVVAAWLKKYSEDHQENRTWLLVPLTIVVFTLFAVITVYRYRAAVRDSAAAAAAGASESADSLLHSSFFDSGSVEAFLLSPRSGAAAVGDNDGDDDADHHPAVEGNLNAAAFEYFDASIGLSASAFDPLAASFQRAHPLRSLRASRRGAAVALRSFRLFESHRTIRAKRVPLRDVALQKLLSRGASGEVWLATLRGGQQQQQVAVKQLLPSKRRQLRETEMFLAEIYLLAQLRHAHIVTLVGIAWNTLEHVLMVQELMERGDLQQFLAAEREKRADSNSSELFTWAAQRLTVAQGVASALAYMHGLAPKLLHRDIKSRNVLLAADMRAKLCDFGISRRKHGSGGNDDANLTATAAAGTVAWTAPELLVGEDYNEKVDVYAFGVLLTELDTCQLPYHDPRSLELRLATFPLRLLKLVLNEEYRPTLSPTCPPRIAALVARCLDRDQEKRPTAHEICVLLAEMDNARVEELE